MHAVSEQFGEDPFEVEPSAPAPQITTVAERTRFPEPDGIRTIAISWSANAPPGSRPPVPNSKRSKKNRRSRHHRRSRNRRGAGARNDAALRPWHGGGGARPLRDLARR